MEVSSGCDKSVKLRRSNKGMTFRTNSVYQRILTTIFASVTSTILCLQETNKKQTKETFLFLNRAYNYKNSFFRPMAPSSARNLVRGPS